MKNTLSKEMSLLEKLEAKAEITWIDKSDNSEEVYVYCEKKQAYETKEEGWFIVPIEFLHEIASGKVKGYELK